MSQSSVVSDLPGQLRITSGMISMGERIAWGRDSTLMDLAAAEIERLTACLKAANADTKRLDLLDRQMEAYGVHEHEGNRWLIEGPFASLRVAIDEGI